MLLEDKHAVIYGGGGSIGRAVALGFAHEGATVHLAGRTRATLDTVADEVRRAGGRADTAIVDALDEASVDAFTDAVVAGAGRIDVSMCLISVGDVQGTPLAEMTLADFEQPIRNSLRSAFITSRAAARHMIPQGSGVILGFGGEGDPIPNYSIGGFQIGLAAVENLQRQLACELGPHGIRVVSLQTGGIGEGLAADMEGRDEILAMITEPTMLKRTATFADVGRVAAFVASDHAASITATQINISCGAIV